MKIYNTMTRQKEEFVPNDPKEVKIYACGPTVYNYIHIGNARPLCVFDVLRRYLEYRGYNVKFVQNFTDVDDKIIKRANEEGSTFEEISKKYIEEFWIDANGLNFKKATVHPKATENIDEIINILKYGTGVVYLGFPECPWCQAYVKYLNETAKDANIEKIYYFNILEDRKNNTEKYQEIVSILGDNLQRDDEGNLKVFVPNVSFVVNGKIIGNDYETSLDTKGFEKPSDYWTEEEVSELENTLSGYMKEVYKALYSCTDCNK